ncbi:MAG: chemotaxis protein CheW [Bacillota bacterium]
MEVNGGKFLTFCLGGEVFAIPIINVKEIIGMMEITHIPKTQGYIKGVVNLRGKIIPIMDLRLKFGMDEKEYTDRTCIVVIEVNLSGSQRLVGVVVDTVTEVLNIKESEIEAPGLDARSEGDFLMGLGKLKDKVVLIVNIEKVLNQAEISIIKKDLATELTAS